MDLDGNVYEMAKDELEYSYRRCILQDGGRILLEVEMELKPGEYAEIKRKMEDYLNRRREKQPLICQVPVVLLRDLGQLRRSTYRKSRFKRLSNRGSYGFR